MFSHISQVAYSVGCSDTPNPREPLRVRNVGEIDNPKNRDGIKIQLTLTSNSNVGDIALTVSTESGSMCKIFNFADRVTDTGIVADDFGYLSSKIPVLLYTNSKATICVDVLDTLDQYCTYYSPIQVWGTNPDTTIIREEIEIK